MLCFRKTRILVTGKYFIASEVNVGEIFLEVCNEVVDESSNASNDLGLAVESQSPESNTN